MTNKAVIIINAGVYGIFAFLLFFFPDFIWPFYSVEINDQYARFLSQHNSIFLGGIAVLSWLWRDVEANSESARKLFFGLLWTNGLGLVITFYACIKGIFVGFGWSDPAFFAFLLVLCFLQMKKNEGYDQKLE